MCLDNDSAGIAAVERLCSGGILSKAASLNGAQFLIASLPDGVKDPGDFIKLHQKGNEKLSAKKFQKDVIRNARDWNSWMVDHIISRYDKKAARGSPGSFGDMFARVSEFLAMSCSNPADRTRSAYLVADRLASIMASDANTTSVSQAARVQLESDLIDAASRIANAKDVMHRRIEKITGGSPTESRKLLTAMSHGTGLQNDAIDTEKLSRNALRKSLNNESGIEQPSVTSYNGQVQKRANPRRQLRDNPKRRTFRPVNKKGKPPALTPHFSGFDFKNENDADWLGIPKEEVRDCFYWLNLVLHL